MLDGLLDDDSQLRPDKHIFVELKADWFQITDRLPQLDKRALLRRRLENANKRSTLIPSAAAA